MDSLDLGACARARPTLRCLLDSLDSLDLLDSLDSGLAELAADLQTLNP